MGNDLPDRNSLMAGGVICPCAVAALVPQAVVVQRLALILPVDVLLFIAGLIVAMLAYVFKSNTKRPLALARCADALGLCIALKPPRDRVDVFTSFPYLKRLKLPKAGKAANMLYGDHMGRPLTVVDYTSFHRQGYEQLVGSRTLAVATQALGLLMHNPVAVRTQTLAVFMQGFEELPTFAVVPITRRTVSLGSSSHRRANFSHSPTKRNLIDASRCWKRIAAAS